MTPQEKAQAWKNLKQMVSKVVDPTLRTMMMAEFRQRAIADWGFDPETSAPTAPQQVELDDWEKALVQDIKDYKDYGVDLHNRADPKQEAHNRMLSFIDGGGTLADIPENIKTDYIKTLYNQCFNEWLENI